MNKKSVEYPVVSLFSGAMGLDLGFEEAGLDVMVSQDYDPWCIETMKANHKKNVPGDIRELLKKDPRCDFLLRPAGVSREEVFAVIGGPPCQPFSTAGKRLSTNDPRGSLFMDFCKVVKEIRPRFFVMENVKGLLSAAIKHRPIASRDKTPLSAEELPGSVFQIIKKAFDEINYKIVPGILDAVHYGVPQFRERLIIIGSRDEEDIFLPIPTHFQLHQEKSCRWRTLREVITDLENNSGPCASFSKERTNYMRFIPMGGNWKSLPASIRPLAMGGAYNSGGGKVGFYRRLDYNQPSPTLVTSPVQKATLLCHPVKDRPLSVKEYARIQQFPDNWILKGSLSDCYRQIGNAVPIGLARAIGLALRSIAEKNSIIKTKRLRGTSVHNKLKHNYLTQDNTAIN